MPHSTSSGMTALQTYAAEINAAVDTITSFCTKEGLAQPSFSPTAPTITLPSTAPLAVQDARQTLVASASQIQKLATEPADYLPNLQPGYQTLACLRWIIRFDILSHIPLSGTISYSELALAAGVPAQQLQSVVRMAMTSNLLCEPSAEQISHNAVSRTFIETPSLIDWANFMTDYSMPTATSLAAATAKYGVTAAKSETAFNVATDTTEPLFHYFTQTPERANAFAMYMKSVQASPGTALSHLLTGFDWPSLGQAVVVDVGGSTCTSSITLASAFPDLRFVVEDLPETILESSSTLTSQPASIRARISTQGYDFFTPQPFKGADVYLFRMILHDWPAAEAQLILSNHVAALKANPTSRMLIMDTVLPRPGSISAVEEALLRVRDLTMTQVFNAKERELDEFEKLFAGAKDEDGCLVLKGLVKPPGSVMSVMEVVYQRYEKI